MKEEILQDIVKKKDLYYRQSQELRTEWEESYKNYINLLDASQFPWSSDIFVPKTYEAVELLTAFLIANNPTLIISPVGPGDTKKARVMNRLISFQWENPMAMYQKLNVWVKQSVLFGTSVMKIFWETKKKKLTAKKKKISFKKQAPFYEWKEEEVEEDKILYDDPRCEVVNLMDFYADFYISDVQKQPMVIHRIVKLLDEVKDDSKYKNTKDLLGELVPASSSESSSRLNTLETNVQESENQKVELLEVWTKEQLFVIGKGGGNKDWVTLRNEPNPYGFIPFIVLRHKDSPLPNRFYGIGAVGSNTNKIQKEINTTTNQIVDNIALVLNKMWIRRRDARINPKQLISRPGGYIDTDNIETDIKAVEYSDIKPSGFAILQYLNNEFQQASGAVDLLKGVAGAEFATEIALEQRNVTTMIVGIKQNIENALSEIGKRIIQLDLDNIQNIRSVKIFDKEDNFEWLEFAPEEIRGEFDIKVKADSTILQDSVVLSKQLLDFLVVISKDNEAIQKVNRIGLYKRWLELKGFNDVDEFFPEKPSPSGVVAREENLNVSPQGTPESLELPTRREQLTPGQIRQSAMASTIPHKEF